MIGEGRLRPHPGASSPCPDPAMISNLPTFVCFQVSYQARGAEGRWSCKGDLDATNFGRRAAAWAAANAQVSCAAGDTATALSPCAQTRVCTACKQPPCRALEIVPVPCFRILAGARRRWSWPLRDGCEREHSRATCGAGAAAVARSGGHRDHRSASLWLALGYCRRAGGTSNVTAARVAQMAVGALKIL